MPATKKPRGPGRPKLPAKHKRAHRVVVLLNAAEHARLTAAAKGSGHPFADFARAALLAAAGTAEQG